MEFGLKARDLILELKRADGVPPFNDDQVRRVFQEMAGLWEEVDAVIGDDQDPNDLPDGEKVFIFTHVQAMERNKRLLLAYVVNRLRRLQRMRWATGPVLPADAQKAASAGEREFFRGYDALVSSYSQAIGLDLAADISPPTELYLAVRALKDVGEVMTESGGSIDLQTGCQYSLRRNDVDQLIRQGFVELIETEE